MRMLASPFDNGQAEVSGRALTMKVAETVSTCVGSGPVAAVIMAAVLLLTVQVFSNLIPPLQSPDEPAHLERAYLLSKGEIILRAPSGVTGGEIDTGLLTYIESFARLPTQYDQKVHAAEISRTRNIHWSGSRRFQELVNTAVYFPLPYIPQAIALALGRWTGLTVDASYKMARWLSLLSSVSLLWGALYIYRTPPIVAALFCIPMSLFQMGSASLDAVTFGTCALASSLSARGVDNRAPFSTEMHIT